jgi:tetraacyldisaccharide 4'-kinase
MNAANMLATPFALLYAGAIRLRNAYYDYWPGAVHRAAVPVISVGNLTVGGTGKTPFVIEVVRRLQSWGRKPGVLTRGYKAARGVPADEVLELREALPGVPVVVNPDRVAGARSACAAEGVDCLVLDDGFQHRRLGRDLDIVLVSALGPPGLGGLLPAGRLREPLSALRRADVLVITRSNQVAEAQLAALQIQLQRYAPDTPIVHAPVEPVGAAEWAGRRVLAVCGLGEPRTFLDLVAKLTGAKPLAQVFRDHHRYDAADVHAICGAAQRAGVEQVVTTRKDWVKLGLLWPPDARTALVCLHVRLVLDADQRLDQLLRQVIR